MPSTGKCWREKKAGDFETKFASLFTQIYFVFRVGLRQMVEQVVKTHSLQQQEDTDLTRNVRGEVQTKTTFQRSAKGNITIAECEANGKYITLENTHRNKVSDLCAQQNSHVNGNHLIP